MITIRNSNNEVIQFKQRPIEEVTVLFTESTEVFQLIQWLKEITSTNAVLWVRDQRNRFSINLQEMVIIFIKESLLDFRLQIIQKDVLLLEYCIGDLELYKIIREQLREQRDTESQGRILQASI